MKKTAALKEILLTTLKLSFVLPLFLLVGALSLTFYLLKIVDDRVSAVFVAAGKLVRKMNIKNKRER
jgi:hypothetical protein